MAVINFLADVKNLPESRIILGKANWAPNLLINGIYYPGRILSVSKLLLPGEQGRVKIGIMLRDGEDALLQNGLQFELRDGPALKVADATIIEIHQ